MGRKEADRLFDRHRKNVTDRLAVVLHLQGLVIKTRPAAILARHVGDRQEVHFQLDNPLSFARVAASALIVEGESTSRVAAQAGLRQSCVECPDRVKDLEVCRGSRPGCLSDG